MFAYAENNWDTLNYKYPTIDLLQLPFGKFLSIMYVEAAQQWGQQQAEERPKGSPEPTYAEFDAILEAPLPKQRAGFAADYAQFMK